jgi:carbamoyl-phosphate synthase small subunit
VNLNDHTNEGMRHRSLPLFSVQYHPEASPGPHDARYLFDDFIAMMKDAAR